MAELDPLTGLESGKGKYTPSPKKESTVVDQQEAKKTYTPSPKRKKQTTHLGGQLTSTPHSKYNFNIGPSDVRSGLDSDIRANNQGFLDEMANSFVQVGSTILGQTAESFGAILDPGAWAAYIGNTDEVYSNALMDFGRNIQEGGREKFPVLQHSSPSWHEWWFQGMPSMASAISMMIPTLGITRGLATAFVRGARLLNGANRAKAVNGLASIMMKGARGAVNPITQAVLSRHAENMMESYQTGAELEEELMLKGYSQEDAKRFAAEGAASNYRTGWWLLGTDILQYGMLGLKTKTPFEKAFGTNAKSGTRISRATDLGTQMVSEGLEESFQYYAAENGKYRARLKAGLIDEKSFFNRFKEGLDDREMWDSFIFGALGGGVFSALGPIAQKYGDKFVSSEEHKRQATDTANFMKGHIGALASQLQDLNAAIESGNPRAVRDVKLSIFSERILQAIHKDYGRQDGTTTNLNNLVKQLEALENASDEELADFAKQSGVQGGVLNKESLSEIVPQIKAEVEIAKRSFAESIYRGNDATFATMYAHSKIMQNRFATQAEEGARNYTEAKENHNGDINDTIVYGQALNLIREGNFFKAMVNMMSQEELNDLEKIAEKYSKMYPYDEETKVPKELVDLAAAELQDRMAAEHSGVQAAKYEDKSYQKEIEKQMNIRGINEATDEQHLKDLAKVLGIEIVDGKLTEKSKDKDLNKAVEEKMAEFEKAKKKAEDDSKKRAAKNNKNPNTVVNGNEKVSDLDVPFGDQSGFSENDTIDDVSSSTSTKESPTDNTTVKVAPEALNIAEVEKAKKVKVFKGDSLINTLGFEFITDEEQRQKLLDYLLKGVSSSDKIRIEINPSLIEKPEFRAKAERLLKHIHNVIGNPDSTMPFEDVFTLINENYAELREALFEIPVSVIIESEDGDLPPMTINIVRPKYGVNGNQINMRASAVAAALSNSIVTTTFYEALPQNSFQIANGEKGQPVNWLIDENASNLYVSTKNGFAKNVRTDEVNYDMAVGTLTPGTYYALITDPTGKQIPVALDRWSKDQPMPPKAVDVLMYIYEGIVAGKISYKADVNAYPRLVNLLTRFAEDMGMSYKELTQIMLPSTGKVDIIATLNFFILEGSYFKNEDGGQNINSPFSIYSSKNKNDEGFSITYAGNQLVIKNAADFSKHRETFRDFLSNKVMNIDRNRVNSNPAYRKFIIDHIFSTDISKDNPWKLPTEKTKKELNEELKRRGKERGTDPDNIPKVSGIPGTPNLSPKITITTSSKTISRNTNTMTIEHGGKTYEVVEKNGKFVLANGKKPGRAIRIIAAMKTKKVPYAVVTINNRGKEMKIAIVDVGNGELAYLSMDGITKGSLFLKNSHIAKAANVAYAKAHPKNTKTKPSDPLVDEAKKIEEELKEKKTQTQTKSEKNTEAASPVKVDFFASAPNEDGSFNTSSTTKTFKLGASVFSFEAIGNGRYNVYIHKDKGAVSMAVQYVDIFIDRIFDPLSATNPNAKEIQTTKPAVVEMQGDKLVLIDRGEIDYDGVGILRENSKQQSAPEAAPEINESNPFGNQLGFADLNGGEVNDGEVNNKKTDDAVNAFDLVLGGKKAPEKKGSKIPKTGC